MTKRQVVLFWSILGCSLLIWSAAAAGTATLERWVFGAGGGPSGAGSVSLHAILGQTVVGEAIGEHVLVAGGYEQPEVPVQTPVEVQIDIRPSNPKNVVRLSSGAKVPVAILSAAGFDAATVNPATVLFAGAVSVGSKLEDVDSDGDLDLLLYFRARLLDLDASDTEATLTGDTLDGTPIEGTDTVKVIP